MSTANYMPHVRRRRGWVAWLVALIAAIVCLLLSGCASTAQRKRGMDNNDARREAFWTGVFSAIGHVISGGEEKPSK